MKTVGVDLKFSEDENGYSHADAVDEKYFALARFLDGDIQGSPPLARRVLDELLNIKTGQKGEWEMTGNAFTLTVNKEKAILRQHYEEVDLDIPFDDFIQAVSGWLKFLESPGRKASR